MFGFEMLENKNKKKDQNTVTKGTTPKSVYMADSMRKEKNRDKTCLRAKTSLQVDGKISTE